MKDKVLQFEHPNRTIKAGTCILFKHGDYPDPWSMGFFVALKDINIDVAIDTFPLTFEGPFSPTFGAHKFLESLIEKGDVMKMPYEKINLGNGECRPNKEVRWAKTEGQND